MLPVVNAVNKCSNNLKPVSIHVIIITQSQEVTAQSSQFRMDKIKSNHTFITCVISFISKVLRMLFHDDLNTSGKPLQEWFLCNKVAGPLKSIMKRKDGSGAGAASSGGKKSLKFVGILNGGWVARADF